MRYFKLVILIILILGGLVLIVNQAFLYSSDTTHPYLTEQIVKFYNYYYDPDITLEQLEKMKEGSTHEDFGDRSVWYHFYDPTYNKGSDRLTAKQWVQNPKQQARTPGGDHSWQTAISDYNAGYKQNAFYSLGHVLHLIEDMAVPAHTRNDAHYNGGDPLENWAGDLPKNSSFYNIAQPLIGKNIKPRILNNLDAYFDEVANFSNKNFFSKDTIDKTIDENGKVKPDAKYFWPKIIKEVFYTRSDGYAYGKIVGNSSLFRLAKIERDAYGNKKYYITIVEDFKVKDSPEIHADYFSILSREAVINGAGVVKLFFESITEPKQEIIEPEKKFSWFQKIGNKIMGTARFVYSIVDGIIHTPPSAMESVIEEAVPETKYLGTISTFAQDIISDTTSPAPQIPEEEKNVFLVEKVIDGDTIILEDGQKVRYIGINAPEFPNGCFAQEATDENKDLVEGKQVRLEKDVSETDDYGRLLRYVYLDSLFINDYLVRNGYAYDWAYEPDVKYKEKLAEAEEEAKENRAGLWGDVCHPEPEEPEKELQSPVFHFPHTGSYRISEEEPISVSPSVEVTASEQDTIPPDVSIDTLSYNYASSSITIQWSSSEYPSVSFDADYKKGDDDWRDLLASTSETQASLSVDVKDIVYYFRVRGRDLEENQSAWQETSIEILSKPVVINEIAWMGTAYRSQDEWIELYNRSNQDIDLAGWSLQGSRSGPDIIFGDNDLISKQGYYLIERTDDMPTSQPADWYGSFGNGLDNQGEALELRDNQENLIDSINYYNDWYAGENQKEGPKWTRKTMERINPDLLGTNLKNWKTYTGSGSSTMDGEGNPIFGTPKAKNSVYKLYSAVVENITQDTTWTLENSPYLVYDNGGNDNELLEIARGATLTIEPGVTVKFVNPGLKVFGTIKAQGTSDKQIVFTTASTPQVGDWSGIYFTESSTDSVLDNIIIRYAGSRTRPFRSGSKYSPAAVGAAIKVEDTSITLKNSIIEHNLFKGVWLINSPNTVIKNSTFQNHLKDECPFPCTEFDWRRNIVIYIDSSSPQIRNSTFQNNLTGIYIINNSSPVIEDNNFSDNLRPIWVQDSYPEFSNNKIEGNDWDGIVLTGLKLTQDYTLGGDSVFINYDSIPSWGIVVPEGRILTIDPGTIIKFIGTSGLTIEGTLIAEGTNGKKIVFTSFYDDEYGGDTNGDGDATQDNAKAGSWGQIVFTPISTDSVLDYVIIRYGGTKWGQSYNHRPDYVLKIEDSDLSLANSVIENNTSGIYLENSNSQITNTTFQDHRYSSLSDFNFTSTGLRLVSSSPAIDLSTFLNNKLGIYIDINSRPNLINFDSWIFEDNNEAMEDLRPEDDE